MKSGCPYICVLVDLKLDAHRITCCNVHAHEITAHEQCNIQNTKQRDVERIYSFVICTVVQFIVQQNKSRRYFMHTAYPNGDNKQNHSVPNMFFSLFNSLRGCVCVCLYRSNSCVHKTSNALTNCHHRHVSRHSAFLVVPASSHWTVTTVLPVQPERSI